MSFREMKSVPGELMEQRITEVKVVSATDLEQYRIVKDELTGDHYLHYRYVHRDVASGGAESSYHQLLPLEPDDVLGLLFNSDPYTYPDAWKRPFLRNGPGDEYIWFDPSPSMEAEEAEREAKRIRDALVDFKRQGNFKPENVEQFLKRLDDDEKR